MIYEWLKDITFAWPANLLLLGLVVLLTVVYFNSRTKSEGRVIASSIGGAMPVTAKARLRHLPFLLRVLSIVCLMLALARPQLQNAKVRWEGEGIDIVLCMDVSGSMGTEDVKPSRFQVAKEVAIAFVKNRPVDRIGLVVFGGESFTKCPLTPDKNTMLSQLQSLRIKDGGYLSDGTLIGEGLATSVARVTKGSSKSKVVILLTDGKEKAGDARIITPREAMEIAKENGVKVYCIGLGSATYADEQMVEDNAGNIVRNDVDEVLMTQIATQTGGQYYRATDKATLQLIYDRIDRLEKSKVSEIRYTEVQEMFMPLVLTALALLFVEVLLRTVWLRKFP